MALELKRCLKHGVKGDENLYGQRVGKQEEDVSPTWTEIEWVTAGDERLVRASGVVESLFNEGTISGSAERL